MCDGGLGAADERRAYLSETLGKPVLIYENIPWRLEA